MATEIIKADGEWGTAFTEYSMECINDTIRNQVLNRVKAMVKNCPSCSGKQVVDRICGNYLWLGVDCVHASRLTRYELGIVHVGVGRPRGPQ